MTGRGRIAPDQDVLPVAQVVEDLRQRQVKNLDVVGGVFEPALPGRRMPAGEGFARWRPGGTAAGGSRNSSSRCGPRTPSRSRR